MKNRKRSWVVALLGLALGSGFGCGGCGAGTGQSQECRDYIACYRLVGGTGDLTTTYEAGGSCWTGVGPMAMSCTEACKSTLIMLKASYPNAGC